MSETTTPVVMPASPIRHVRHFILHPDVAEAHADAPMSPETHAAVAEALVEAAKGGSAVTLMSADSSSMLLVHPDDHVDVVAAKVAEMHELPAPAAMSSKSKASAKPPKDSIENG